MDEEKAGGDSGGDIAEVFGVFGITGSVEEKQEPFNLATATIVN
jgi:hypothetical protein